MDDPRGQRVVDALHRLVDERRQYLIFTSGGYYVQFAAAYPPGWRPQPDDDSYSFAELFARMGLFSEAVSDQYLEPGQQLGADGAARLSSLGWTPPGENTNWTRIFDLKTEDDYGAIAEAVVKTFTDAYLTAASAEIEFGDVVAG